MKQLLLVLFLLTACGAAGQRRVSGCVATVGGSAVEYANIGIEGTRTGVTANDKGEFAIVLPAGSERDTLTVSHVSFDELRVPVATLGAQVVFTLTPKTHVAREVVVTPAKQKVRTLDGHGLRIASGAFSFMHDPEKDNKNELEPSWVGTEAGSVVKVGEEFLITEFRFEVTRCMGDVKVRVNVYRMDGDDLKNILNYPIYVDLGSCDVPMIYSIAPEEVIILEKGRYFVALEVIVQTADEVHRLDFPAYLKPSLVREGKMGAFEKFPFNLGLVVRGHRL